MPVKERSNAIMSIGQVESKICFVRSQRVLLAADLARMYGVTVKQLNQAVRRNADRFPEDFVFQLTKAESDALSRSQFVTLNEGENLKSQIVTSRWGGARRALPYAFTEHGVLMAANVLRSSRAAKASVFIVRAFIKLRNLLATHHQLAQKLAALEQKLQDHDGQMAEIMGAIRELMQPPPDDPPGYPFGFHSKRLPQAKKR
jgi:hypothetical protein